MCKNKEGYKIPIDKNKNCQNSGIVLDLAVFYYHEIQKIELNRKEIKK
jgi:hypothetical protein